MLPGVVADAHRATTPLDPSQLALLEPSAASVAPLIKWAGGKRGLWTHIHRLIPRTFDRFVEPFVGGGTVFLKLRPNYAMLNDANASLMEMYAVVRDQPSELATELDQLQTLTDDEAAYYEIRAQDPEILSPAARSARFIFLNKTGYNGLYRVNRAGQFNVPFGRRSSTPRLYDPQNLHVVSRALKRAELRCGDFDEAMSDVGAGDFVYVDPPYVPATASANFTRYTAEDFGPAEQQRLADAVARATRRGAKVLVSNSDTPVVRELYRGFSAYPVEADRRINSDPAGRKGARELLITTYV